MQENEIQSAIYPAMAAIMAEAKAIGKDSRNQQQGFNFRGIDAVMNHLHPIFARHKVIVLPCVLEDKTEERETRSGGHLIYRVLRIQFTFVAADGSRVQCVTIGEGMDSGDKAANKAMAVALKYALSQTLLLPYDEVDPDAETPEASKPKRKQPEKPPVEKPKEPVKAKPPVDDKKITQQQRKLLFAKLHDCGVLLDEFKAYLAEAWKLEHTADILKTDMDDIVSWIESHKDEVKGGEDGKA